MKVKELQIAFNKSMRSYFPFLIPNTYIKDWFECDIIGVKDSGYVHEIEIKMSRSDYKEDFKKSLKSHINHPLAKREDNRIITYKHDLLQGGYSPINYFSFLTPKGLLNIEDVPANYGLYEFDGRYVSCLRTPRILHRRKADNDFKHHCLRNVVYKYWDLLESNVKLDHRISRIESTR